MKGIAEMERFNGNHFFLLREEGTSVFCNESGKFRAFETGLCHVFVCVCCFVKYLTFLLSVQGTLLLLKLFDTVLSGAQFRCIRSFGDSDNSLLSNSIHGLISSCYRTDASAKG